MSGGTLRVGVSGGSPADVMDPQYVLDIPASLYSCALYDQLSLVNEDIAVENRLAEEISSSDDATQWTVRLRQGVEFHNGKTLTADDVIYSYKRLTRPNTTATLAFLGNVIASMEKLDPLTVRFTLRRPMGWFDTAIGAPFSTGIVPIGFDLKQPVGTGPFKLVSFTAGQQAVFERFPNYWDGPAHLDKLVIYTINDSDALLNALVAGQIDADVSVLPVQAAQVRSQTDLVLYNSPSSSFTPITMRVDKAPLNDVRVRQALRLCVNRPQVLEAAASGYGVVANDLYSPYDPNFDKSLVRHQDVEQAKSLLRQAGQTDLRLQLVTSPVNGAILSQCQVLAENASQVGVTIAVRQVDPTTLFGPNYLSWPFAIDDWPGLPWQTQSTFVDSPVAPNNETHFKLPRYETLWNQAFATLSASRRKELAAEMQAILFNEGGYIIPMFQNQLSACPKNLGGYRPHDYRGLGPVATNMNKLYLSS